MAVEGHIQRTQTMFVADFARCSGAAYLVMPGWDEGLSAPQHSMQHASTLLQWGDAWDTNGIVVMHATCSKEG